MRGWRGGGGGGRRLVSPLKEGTLLFTWFGADEERSSHVGSWFDDCSLAGRLTTCTERDKRRIGGGRRGGGRTWWICPRTRKG